MIAAAKIAIQVLRRFGPYAAIELLLPGGSLLAILLWLYRRNRAGVRPSPCQLIIPDWSDQLTGRPVTKAGYPGSAPGPLATLAAWAAYSRQDPHGVVCLPRQPVAVPSQSTRGRLSLERPS
jgi:hypothetical protein